MTKYKDTIIPDNLVSMDDDEYDSFVRAINDFAEKAAVINLQNDPELQSIKLFSFTDLYNFAMMIDEKCRDIYFRKGVKLLEYISTI